MELPNIARIYKLLLSVYNPIDELIKKKNEKEKFCRNEISILMKCKSKRGITEKLIMI